MGQHVLCPCSVCVTMTLTLAAPTLTIGQASACVLLSSVGGVDGLDEENAWHPALDSRPAGDALLETAPDDAKD